MLMFVLCTYPSSWNPKNHGQGHDVIKKSSNSESDPSTNTNYKSSGSGNGIRDQKILITYYESEPQSPTAPTPNSKQIWWIWISNRAIAPEHVLVTDAPSNHHQAFSPDRDGEGWVRGVVVETIQIFYVLWK